jgi:hypothetical protein
MSRRRRTPEEDADRERFSHGLPDYHDPTAGLGGAAPARSALTLRLVLAGFGLVFCVGSALWLVAVEGPGWLVVVLLVLAAIAVVDLVVVARRKLRGEPG